MRPLPVVIVGKLTDEMVQVPRAQHDEAVETLAFQGENEPLGVGVEVRAPGRQPHGRDSDLLQRAVEPSAELAVPVAQEQSRPVPASRRVCKELGLLCHPHCIGLGGARRDVHATALDVDEDQDEGFDQALHRPDPLAHEVAGPQGLSVRFQELIPRALDTLRAGGNPVTFQDV